MSTYSCIDVIAVAPFTAAATCAGETTVAPSPGEVITTSVDAVGVGAGAGGAGGGVDGLLEALPVELPAPLVPVPESELDPELGEELELLAVAPGAGAPVVAGALPEEILVLVDPGDLL